MDDDWGYPHLWKHSFEPFYFVHKRETCYWSDGRQSIWHQLSCRGVSSSSLSGGMSDWHSAAATMAASRSECRVCQLIVVNWPVKSASLMKIISPRKVLSLQCDWTRTLGLFQESHFIPHNFQIVDKPGGEVKQTLDNTGPDSRSRPNYQQITKELLDSNSIIWLNRIDHICAMVKTSYMDCGHPAITAKSCDWI